MNSADIIPKISDNLKLKEGIWVSAGPKEVSYPTEAAKRCFSVEDDSFWFRHRNNCILKIIKKFPPDDFILNIGGSNGFLDLALQKHGFSSLLLDPSTEAILNAKKRGLDNLICSRLEDAGFRDSSLKSIGIFDVLEHQKNDTAFLSIINNMLVHKGKLFISVPALNILWSYNDVLSGHFRRYNLKSLAIKLEKMGFRLLYGTYLFSSLFVPIYLFRKIPTILGIKKPVSDRRLKDIHVKKYGIFSAIMDKICEKELLCIERNRKILLGSSCLVAAEKTRKIQ